MKKMNKKGFTIVELVIVIAVIAILAAVLIPTFSGVVSKANASAAQQTAKSTLSNALSMSSTAQLPKNTRIVVDGYAFNYTGNQLEACDYPITSGAAWTLSTTSGDKNYNAVIISADSLAAENTLVSTKDYTATNNTTMTLKNDVAKILAAYDKDANPLGCIDATAAPTVTCVITESATGAKTTHYYVNYVGTSDEVKYTDADFVTISSNKYLVSDCDTKTGSTEGYTEVSGTWYKVKDGKTTTTLKTGDVKTAAVTEASWDAEIYVNVDLDKDVVVFTNFGK